MTQEIIEMAKQVGLATWHKDLKKWQLEYGVEAFAKLVAEHERNRLYDKFMEIHESQKHSNNYWHVAAVKIKEDA